MLGARRADKPRPPICSAKLSITTQWDVSIETSSTTRSLRKKISTAPTLMALATREASLLNRLQEQRRGRLWGLPTRTLTSHSESRWAEIKGHWSSRILANSRRWSLSNNSPRPQVGSSPKLGSRWIKICSAVILRQPLARDRAQSKT